MKTFVHGSSKYTKLISCFMGEELLTAKVVALLFFYNVNRYFDIPTYIVHYRDPRFTSNFWKSF